MTVNKPSKCMIFHKPVDPSMEGCEDYYQVILEEMDLEKMKNKANRCEYRSIQSFREDFDLMIDNCCSFNFVSIFLFSYSQRNPDLIAYANDVRKAFDEDWIGLMKYDSLYHEEYLENSSGRICHMCNQTDTDFSPVVYQCQGGCNRNLDRYMRYFVNSSMTFMCCCACYLNLPESFQYNESVIRKEDLIPRQNDETLFEPVLIV